MKNIDEYGQFVDEFWMSSGNDNSVLTERDFRIMETGLPGEVGELMELIKKEVRDGTVNRPAMKKELGDIAYYWARICSAYGFTLSDVLQTNFDKLHTRRANGTMKGSGNDR